ncbi:hypothetical protein BJ875DRAFT_20434 [Amylocarpus encephaloides]|uniref:Uncharacterized protein n=1 Tax=Amylocarpus encephaloides TaxID=45428 RepID=A0A9P7YJL7_9HELO|nr:hypothetical protein BJ875DRAFT_20434 [Amylocarpus encephaloides]
MLRALDDIGQYPFIQLSTARPRLAVSFRGRLQGRGAFVGRDLWGGATLIQTAWSGLLRTDGWASCPPISRFYFEVSPSLSDGGIRAQQETRLGRLLMHFRPNRLFSRAIFQSSNGYSRRISFAPSELCRLRNWMAEVKQVAIRTHKITAKTFQTLLNCASLCKDMRMRYDPSMQLVTCAVWLWWLIRGQSRAWPINRSMSRSRIRSIGAGKYISEPPPYESR